MNTSQFYPGWLEARQSELKVGQRVRVSYGIVVIDELLAPDEEGFAGFLAAPDFYGVRQEIRRHPSNTWFVKLEEVRS